MLQLSPQTNFPVIRKLGDPADTATYYVRAIVRNSASGATIQTINLTDGGSQRFTGNFNVPRDSSGTGMYVDITTSVYTDSGYTAKSDAYSEENETYLVAERWGPQFGHGGSGGGDISYGKIGEIFNEILLKYLKGIIDLQVKIYESVEIIKAKDFPEIKTTDLSPVLEAIRLVAQGVEGIDFPEIPAFPTIPEPIDHREELKALFDQFKLFHGKLISLEGPRNSLTPEDVKKIEKSMDVMREKIGGIESTPLISFLSKKDGDKKGESEVNPRVKKLFRR